MAENTKFHPITIDLKQFKLHIELKNRIKLTLHFDSPSRRFYLSLIAFVVNEMKRLGKITSIPLEGHHDLLVLLNETIGGSAGSSEEETLLSRIYRKWKDALPNLEEAPLFKVLGRKKGYEEGAGKIYPFNEAEKDIWANLFEYQGSHENVRLKFAIDKIGVGLEDVEIIYEASLEGEAWERFLSGLKGRVKKVPEPEPIPPLRATPESLTSLPEKKGIVWQTRRRWVALVAGVVLVIGVGTLTFWKLYLEPARHNRASVESMAYPLPDMPSIAVMPFVNMSGDPKQEFLCDGMTEKITTALSKVPRLFVIARNSAFTYKGKSVKVKQVSEDLGVRFVLEGSVQRSGDRLRITAQLIDALTGNHLWAEGYDRDLKDLFAVQDEVTLKILRAMQINLTEGEKTTLVQKYTCSEDLECYLKYLEALKYLQQGTIDGTNLALRKSEEALALCPGHT